MKIDAQTEVGNTSVNQSSLEDLSVFGITTQTIEKAKAGKPVGAGRATSSHRQVHIDAICQIAKDLIAEYNGIMMFCAATVLRALIERGYGKTAKGQIIRGPNAIGDALGKHGLNLASINKGGKLRYALSMVDATAEEKALAQERLNSLTKEQSAGLPVA